MKLSPETFNGAEPLLVIVTVWPELTVDCAWVAKVSDGVLGVAVAGVPL